MKKIDRILFAIKFSAAVFASIYILNTIFKIHQENLYLESLYTSKTINYLNVNYISVNSYSSITD